MSFRILRYQTRQRMNRRGSRAGGRTPHPTRLKSGRSKRRIANCHVLVERIHRLVVLPIVRVGNPRPESDDVTRSEVARTLALRAGTGRLCHLKMTFNNELSERAFTNNPCVLAKLRSFAAPQCCHVPPRLPDTDVCFFYNRQVPSNAHHLG